MNRQEDWYYGISLNAALLRDFCRDWDFDKLYDAINCELIEFPPPLRCFSDIGEGASIIVPTNIFSLSVMHETCSKDICGYTEEELVEMIFNTLNKANYLNKEAYQVVKKLDNLSDEAFKTAFIDYIADSLEIVENSQEN